MKQSTVSHWVRSSRGTRSSPWYCSGLKFDCETMQRQNGLWTKLPSVKETKFPLRPLEFFRQDWMWHQATEFEDPQSLGRSLLWKLVTWNLFMALEQIHMCHLGLEILCPHSFLAFVLKILGQYVLQYVYVLIFICHLFSSTLGTISAVPSSPAQAWAAGWTSST